MSDGSSDGIRSFRRQPARTSIEVDAVANAAGVVPDDRRTAQFALDRVRRPVSHAAHASRIRQVHYGKWKISLRANSGETCILIGAVKGSRAKSTCRLPKLSRRLHSLAIRGGGKAA